MVRLQVCLTSLKGLFVNSCKVLLWPLKVFILGSARTLTSLIDFVFAVAKYKSAQKKLQTLTELCKNVILQQIIRRTMRYM